MSEPSLDQLGVDDVVAGTASMLASLGFVKLEAGDLPQAKRAIDAIATILPLVEDENLQRDLGAALASLQVAYAARV